MRKCFAIIITAAFFLLYSNSSSAQQPVPLITGTFRLPADSFLMEIQKITNLSFYYHVRDLDSLPIDITVKGETLEQVLRQAFANTPIRFSIDAHNNVFITRTLSVAVSVPDEIFDEGLLNRRNTAKNPANATALPDITKPSAAASKSTLENKLYVIGEPIRGAVTPGRVTIAGYLHEVKTGEPVAGASIYLENSKIGAISDQYGYYSMTVPKGRIILNIQSLGIRDTRRQVMVYGEGKMNIDLQEQVIALKNVVVSTEKNSQIRGMQMGMQKLDIKTIKQVPVAFGEADILRVVMTLPGVKTVGEASTGLNVRGGSADQNLILFNDATIYNPSHFFGMFSAFNPEVVKDVELYKSVIPAKYGGRLSSVLAVNSREGNKKEVTGSAGIGLLTSRFNIEGPIKKDKTSFMVGARTTYANWLLQLLPDQYKNSKASFYDVNLNITHEINKKNSLYLTAYLSKDHFNLNNDTTYGYGNGNLSLKWKHVINNKWNFLMAGGYDSYNYSIGSNANPVAAYKLKFDVNQSYFKTHFTYFLSNKHTLEFGVNTLLYQLHPGSYQPALSTSLVIPTTIEQEQGLESALYLSDKYAITPDLSVEGAVRYSMFNYLGKHSVNIYPAGIPKTESNIISTVDYEAGKVIKTYSAPEFRISARYALSANMSLKAGYNTQRQYIHVLSNTAAIAPTDIWKLSDPNIKPQYGDQVSLGLYHNFKSNTIETSVEVYYKHINDYLDYKSGATLVLNPHIETDVVSTKGKAYGVEVLLKKTQGKLNGWLSYTFSRTLLQMSDSTMGSPINKGAWYPANYDKPHDATFVGNYRISHRFSISVNMNYSTGRPITLPIGRFYYSGSERTLYSDRNAYRIPDYFRTDLSLNIDGNHKVHQLTHNSFTIGVYNLTGRKNPYSVYYVSEGGVVNGYKLSIFGSAIPYINYNIRF